MSGRKRSPERSVVGHIVVLLLLNCSVGFFLSGSDRPALGFLLIAVMAEAVGTAYWRSQVEHWLSENPPETSP